MQITAQRIWLVQILSLNTLKFQKLQKKKKEVNSTRVECIMDVSKEAIEDECV